MENNVPAPEVTGPGEATPAMSFFQRLIGVYFEPRKTYDDISRKPSWLGIWIIASILAIGMNYVLTTRVDHETLMRKSLAMNPMTKNLPEEQIQTIVAQPQGALSRYSQMIFAPVGVLLVYILIAAVFLLLFVLMGANITFKKSLAATFWGMGPPGIIGGIFAIIVMYLKDPLDIEINPVANVASNLGLLVAEKEHPVLNSLLSSIDVFSFWTIFLLSLSFAALSGRSMTVKKSATGVLILWALWVVGKAAYFAIF
jgi:disulfide bond formation protein DsbB